MSHYIAGIDPGAEGYIAILGYNRVSLSYKYPTFYINNFYKLPRLDGQNLLNVYAMAAEYMNIDCAFIEEPGTYTKNMHSLARQHREYAEIRAVYQFLKIKIHAITPKEWKNYFGLTKQKMGSIAKAAALVKNMPPLKLKDNDLAEACLIGIYGIVRENHKVINFYF